MNILYLCDEYPPGRHGGIGTAVRSLAREMVKKGHTVVVAGFYDWGYGGSDSFNDEGVHVLRFRRTLDSKWFHRKDEKRVRASYRLLKMSGIFQLDIERSLKKYQLFLEQVISKYHIDIIESPDFNEYMQYCTRVTPFPVLSKPTVVKLHGTISYMLKERSIEPSPVLFEMERKVIENATAICSVSKYTAEKTAEYFHFNRPVSIVYNGVTVEQQTRTAKIPGQVIFTGSLVEKKGIYQLMKAWNIVAAKMPDAKLLVLGKGHIEKAEAFLSAESKRSVSFKGHVPTVELFDSIKASSVAVFPSYAETFGLAAAEAMACGTATIFSTRTSGPEVIRDGIDGFTIDPDNVDELAEKIMLLLTDEQMRTKFEQNGRERIQQEFETGKVADKNIELYEQVLRQSAES